MGLASSASPAMSMVVDRRLRWFPSVELRWEHVWRRGQEQSRCGEVAGGTTAKCAVVCCFLCVVVVLVVLAAVRVPAALCRRAVRARRRLRRTAALKMELEALLATVAAFP